MTPVAPVASSTGLRPARRPHRARTWPARGGGLVGRGPRGDRARYRASGHGAPAAGIRRTVRCGGRTYRLVQGCALLCEGARIRLYARFGAVTRKTFRNDHARTPAPESPVCPRSCAAISTGISRSAGTVARTWSSKGGRPHGRVVHRYIPVGCQTVFASVRARSRLMSGRRVQSGSLAGAGRTRLTVSAAARSSSPA